MSAAELAVLLLCGMTAAALSAFSTPHLRIPGHAIVRSIFPMALGLALVPRHGAGVCMSAASLATALTFRGLGFGSTGVGAITSLVLTGPVLDFAVRGARSGWRLYVGFVLGGLSCNLISMVIRGGAKELMPLRLGGRPFAEWLAVAAFTYPVCGILAGLISALVWFRFRSPQSPTEPPR